MRKRKILPLLALVVLFFVMLPQAPAHCEGQKVYGRVLKNGVILYKNETMTEDDVYFVLPYSYYVVILNSGAEDDYYQVEYQEYQDGYSKVIGYVNKDDLTIWENPTPPLYPVIPAVAVQAGHLYLRPDSSSQKLLMISHDQKLRIYGSYYSEADDLVYYYVIFSQYAGYVPATIVDVTHPGNHPDPVPTPTPPPTPPPPPSNSPGLPGGNGDQPSGGDDSLLQIILIAAICVPALIIVYLMFKPSRRVKYNLRNYYDEDESE